MSVSDVTWFAVSFCEHMIGEGGIGDGGSRSVGSDLGLGERLRVEEETGEFVELCTF